MALPLSALLSAFLKEENCMNNSRYESRGKINVIVFRLDKIVNPDDEDVVNTDPIIEEPQLVF